MDNKKLTKENQELHRLRRELTEQIAGLKNQVAELSADQEEKDAIIVKIKSELEQKMQDISKLESDNLRLRDDVNIMTNRILEEKNKLIDMFNEANMMTQQTIKNPRHSMSIGSHSELFLDENGHDLKRGKTTDDFDDLTNLIKPEYLNMIDAHQVYGNLPYDVKQKVTAHNNSCTALCFNPNGDIIATGGSDKCVNLYNTQSMVCKATLKMKDSVCALAFSLDNHYLMTCSTDHKSVMYNLKTLKPVHSLTAHQDLVTSTKFCYSSKSVVTSSLDSTIKFWDVNSCNIQHVIKTYSSCYDCHISRSETYISSGHKDGSIKVWNAKSKELCFKIDDAHADPVACVRMTSNEQYIVSTSKDDTIKVWDFR